MVGNQQGFTLPSFIVALVIAVAFSAILFAMSMTLMTVEITQYITYSAARAQLGGNVAVSDQTQAARDKYSTLVSSPVLAPLFTNGWFQISDAKTVEVKNGTGDFNSSGTGSFRNDYPATGLNKEIWTGVRTKFTALILSMRLPFIGKTNPDDTGLSASIMSVLIREPSQTECQSFINGRFQKVIALDPRFAPYAGFVKSYESAEDNGC